MISTLHPNDTAICEYGICKVITEIKQTRDGREYVFGYWVQLSTGSIRLARRNDIERIPTAADLAWAADMVQRVIANRVAG